MRSWTPTLGAIPSDKGTHFRVWAPERESLSVVIAGRDLPLTKSPSGYFEGLASEAQTGDVYQYRIESDGPFPDPASRFQPQGVHGPSRIVDPHSFEWSDRAWKGVPLDDLVLYELHVGTFTPEGTFAAAAERFEYLRDLGITAIELMPLSDFPGERNWGYDGVSIFAPARCYGTPDDLRRLVDRAHAIGLAVHLDVIYNHLGPDGAYHGCFSSFYYSKTHRSPWGAGINFDGERNEDVRRFFIENALHWIHEYHIDGLRLDATHAIVDESSYPFLAQLTVSVRESPEGQSRRALVIAEDIRNQARMLAPVPEGGWGLDGVWSDDFHHQMRRALAGDSDGYFQDFDGTPADIAQTINDGWFYSGQFAAYFKKERGTSAAGLSAASRVFFLQNHDQIGNRAFGDRLHHAIGLPEYRAASVLFLLAPETPLLFMGQEWGASTPFQFFTNHNLELGRLVTEGRRHEFKSFSAFSEPGAIEQIPDPQDLQTFERCKLNWAERNESPHSQLWKLHETLLRLRRTLTGTAHARAQQGHGLALHRGTVVVFVWLKGSGALDIGSRENWKVLLSTEDSLFASDPLPMEITPNQIRFHRPGAVVLETSRKGG